jgi:hypothetical protein
MNEEIHASADADTTGYTYTQVYCSVAASPTINGVVVPMIAGSYMPIIIRTISATNNIFVLGRKKLIAPSVING